ncbi:hypothetical protein Q1695_004983 [Nippostrongylus brasiliensis]|nr:hypothetical protein Q1695_004983 [Nippostrongylus brasiliensis]
MGPSAAPLNVTDVTELLQGAVERTVKDNPPEPIFSDYLEMTSLVLMFIIGAPLNLAAYTQFIISFRLLMITEQRPIRFPYIESALIARKTFNIERG